MGLGLLILLCAVSGLAIGSLLVVIAQRVPEGGAVSAPPLVIELTTAILFVLLAVKFRDDVALVAFCILGATLVVQSWIDLRTHRLPRAITAWGTGIGAIALVLAAVVRDEPERIWMAALGAAIAGALIGSVYVGSKWYYGSAQGFGWGDVLLAPLLGMYLGWLDPGIVAPGVFLGFVIGAVAGLVAIAVSRSDRRAALPFAPSLAAGTLVTVFVGQRMIDVLAG